jgi:signal transduction histidine kinase
VYIIAECNDVKIRLASLQAGITDFFNKSIKAKNIIQTLDNFKSDSITSYRVLIIDDDDVSLMLYSELLQIAGLQVKSISNPLQGLSVLNEFKPDILILDIHMPNCSGIDLAQIIRQDINWDMMPILYLTVEHNSNIQLEAISLNGDGYFLKTMSETQQFLTIVLSKAKRARHFINLNKQIKQHQAELIKAKEEAVKANKAKSKFLSCMSHELRTPMNAILGFGQLIKMEQESKMGPSKEIEDIDEVLGAARHLIELINEILDLSKIEAGHIELSNETILLSKVMYEAVQMIHPLAKKRDIEIIFQRNGVDIDFDSMYYEFNHTIQSDYSRLKQVLLNLMSNAVKYNCHQGKIIINCKHNDNGQIKISISDTGQGLNQEQQSELFQPFNRLGAERTEIEGTGIGLMISKQIINMMGGMIGVESQPGHGSTFWFTLPSNNLQQNKNNNSHQKQVTEQEKIQNLKSDQISVLYIEDNPANLRLVTQLLELHTNFQILSAPEPLLGLELATELLPDLILLDINLPGMDGFEVLKKLKHQEVTRDIPIVAVSASAMPKDIEKGITAGFDDYITKPIDIKKFLLTINKYLGTFTK